MKVAILSMQEVKNYGSFLQAFSLKSNIEALGHTCEFVNIVPGEQLDKYKQEKFYKIKLLLKRLWGWDFIKRVVYIYKFQTRFEKEFFPYLGVKKGTTTKHFDIIVIGSDEVFNCAQKTWFGFSRQLFGEGLNTDKVITYAASFGATTVEKLEQLNIKNLISSLLERINQISVRDENSYYIVDKLIHKTPSINVDPVIIYDYSKYMPKMVELKDYVIVYTYPGRITDKNEINAIRNFALTKGLKLVSIGHYFSWVDKVITPTPFEVLAYFKNANYIITDTFHGTIFSLKYNKQFCTIIRDMNNQKLTLLLKQFALTDRIVRSVDDISVLMDQSIDYGKVNNIIKIETEMSVDYLKKNLC